MFYLILFYKTFIERLPKNWQVRGTFSLEASGERETS